MYDSYPQHDVPQNNVIQRFFGQRWSAIVIEILMTIVITVAAGRAFDIFDPFDEPAVADASIRVEEVIPPEFARAFDGVPPRTLKKIVRQYIDNGQFSQALAMVDRLSLAKPQEGDREWYLEIAKFYVTLGESRKAALNYRRYFELVGKSAYLVAQSGLDAARGAD